ncbi:MAG: nucleoside deaminase [Clostridiaceae bacterium]|nr:nucleoside deaminase [Clostridiaceae bacterium]
MTALEKRFMERALLLALQAAEDGEIPVGAVVVKNNEIIGEGRNRREKKKTPLAHAEIEAIHTAAEALGDWRLSGCELYVTLEPCSMCAGAILNSRLSLLVFGAYDEAAGAVISRENVFSPFRNDVRVVGGFFEIECRSLLTEFFTALR